MKPTRFAMLLSLLIVMAWTCPATADPLGGQVLKFQQFPLDGLFVGETVYWGHNELSTAYSTYSQDTPPQLTGYSGWFMADDFADPEETPVVHLRWWGSYLNKPDGQQVEKFLIAFESDVPAVVGTPNFSHPGDVLSTQVVTRGDLSPGSGTFAEKLRLPGTPSPEPTYEYNAELHLGKEFQQTPHTVYWLKIVALVDIDPGVQDPLNDPDVICWGWHNRLYAATNFNASRSPDVVPGERKLGTITDPASGDYVDYWHFQDDAVSGTVSVGTDPISPNLIQGDFQPETCIDRIDGPDGISQYSKDLAFELWTIPEPATLSLLIPGGLLVMRRRRRQKRG